jgi:hypothetical protein
MPMLFSILVQLPVSCATWLLSALWTHGYHFFQA